MKFFWKSIFILLFININLVAQDQGLKSLVNQLGAENYQDREAATTQLWEMGKKALEALKEATQSSDPEISDRAKLLVARIELGVTPNTPRALIKTLQKYHDSDDQAKGQMLIELSRQEEGWLIIRTLLLKDLDQNLADIILSQVDTNMILSLRDKGQHKDAGAILELAVIFNPDPSWIYNLAAYTDETNSQTETLERFTSLINLVSEDKFEIKASIFHTQAILYRSIKKYEEAAKSSQDLYKLAFAEDSDSLKDLSKPLFIDTHLLAEKYAYLESFWEKTSLEIPEKNRLWNVLWLQRMQGKDFSETLNSTVKLMDNENDYLTLSTVLLLNGEKSKALEILEKYEDYEILAELARSGLDYITYEKWLKKAAEKEEDYKLELLAFNAVNKGDESGKDSLLQAVDKRTYKTKKLTALLYLHQAGFKKESKKRLATFLADKEIEDNDALRAAWTLTEKRSLGELFVTLRDKSKNKTPEDALELVTLLSLTEDPDSFVEYVRLLEEKFEGYHREMRQITSILGSYCLEKEWNASAAGVMALMEPAQRGLFNSLMESEARIRNQEYTKAVHNLLGPVGTPKISLPYYLVAQAYALNNEVEKQEKALEFARAYDMGRENIISMTSQYLYENGHYDFFLETTEKLTRMGAAMSPFRTRSFERLSSSHIHNLKHSKAKPYFMAYYKLASSDLTLLQGGPSEAMRLAYQFNEYKLREAVEAKDKANMKKYAAKCEELFLNNIEVPILLKNSDFNYSQELHKKYFNNQWSHMAKSIQSLPNHSILLNSIAWLGALNDYELNECLKFVEKAIKLQPSAANYDTRAEVLYRLKMYKEALESIEKAANLDKLEPFFRDRVDMFRKAAEANK
ncbi:MAG: hypothetical protein MK132_01150 [Lentisphaerales bacterium]|nr:hypothetical protein [Lentisphaerales bacterium]